MHKFCFIGYKGRGIKNRFHMPSAAMSVPSLSVSNDSTLDVTGQSSCSVNGTTPRSAASSGGYNGKKSKSQGSIIPAKDDNGTEEKKTTSNTTKSSHSTGKKVENKRNKTSSKSAEDLSENSSKRRESKTENDDASDKENNSSNCDSTRLANDNMMNMAKVKNCTVQQLSSSPLSEALHEKYGKSANYLCDPSIPETSETSDGEDHDRNKTIELEKLTPRESITVKEVDIQEQLLFQSEHNR